MDSISLTKTSVKKQFASIVFATVSFIVALAWNSFFTKWIGDRKRNVNFTLLYAVFATIVGVIVASIAFGWAED